MIDAKTAPYGALLLRLSLGVMLLAHSLVLKLFVFGLGGNAAFFQSIGLPALLGYVVFAAEAAAGIMLIAGWQTRLASLGILPILVGATWAHAANGWLFAAPGGGWEYPLFLVAAAGVQALLGDGAYALSAQPGRTGYSAASAGRAGAA